MYIVLIPRNNLIKNIQFYNDQEKPLLTIEILILVIVDSMLIFLI